MRKNPYVVFGVLILVLLFGALNPVFSATLPQNAQRVEKKEKPVKLIKKSTKNIKAATLKKIENDIKKLNKKNTTDSKKIVLELKKLKDKVTSETDEKKISAYRKEATKLLHPSKKTTIPKEGMKNKETKVPVKKK